VVQFKCGDFSTCDAPRPGRPKTVTTPEIIDQIHELILGDRQISDKSIAEHLGISRERIGSIIHEDLDLRRKKLVYLGFQCLDHPPYSPDVASSDYHLFSGLKKTIERSPFFRCGGHFCRGDLVGRTNF